MNGHQTGWHRHGRHHELLADGTMGFRAQAPGLSDLLAEAACALAEGMAGGEPATSPIEASEAINLEAPSATGLTQAWLAKLGDLAAESGGALGQVLICDLESPDEADEPDTTWRLRARAWLLPYEEGAQPDPGRTLPERIWLYPVAAGWHLTARTA